MTIGEGDQPTSASLDGYWEGLAVSQGAALKVRLYFENQDNGFKATIDFPT